MATNYVNAELAAKAKASVSIDTAMCVYAMWDERGNVTQKDTGGVNRTVTRYLNKAIYNKIDSMIYAMRLKNNVVFKVNEYKDEQLGNPAKMIAKADSLRDTGNTSEASCTIPQPGVRLPVHERGGPRVHRACEGADGKR